MKQEPALANHGRSTTQHVPQADFPLADSAVCTEAAGSPSADVLLVNPPAPDGGIWIRSQHRVGRRSREGMIWPQVGLAQMAALFPDRAVDIVDAIPQRMTWAVYEAILREKRPAYYVTQVAAPTLANDMYGVLLAKSLGATTIAFGTHVTPLPVATMQAYPALDYVLRGEPELTLRELVDTLGVPNREHVDHASVDTRVPCTRVETMSSVRELFSDADPTWKPSSLSRGGDAVDTSQSLARIKGLVWRRGSEVVVNSARPFIRDLDKLPMPRHDLLPLELYRAPLVGGPYAFVTTSRGCPGGCRFCIKHVSYGASVRFRSPAGVVDEIAYLGSLGVRRIHMYADLFTLNRDHVMGICDELLRRGLDIRWTCNSRVDFVDEEMLRAMARSGCWVISWGIESGDEGMLRRMHKGTSPQMAARALGWAKQAGIKNYGYFIIGLPGETETSILRTIAFAKALPLDLALFHIAAPHPGTPFFFEVVENGWFRQGTRWEQVDMDRSTVLDYPNLSAEDLERWARRAFREWALRPKPLFTYLKMAMGNPSLWRSAVRIGIESLGWARG